MKKFLLALALMSMTFAFAGCGAKEEVVEENATDDTVVTPETPTADDTTAPAADTVAE
ncbi:MAG: hypothetical protein WC269_03150 [Candidatus Gracilibacteria bacterium]|jgi:hypothetical protein